MKPTALGFALLHQRRAASDPVAHAAALELATSPAWAGEMRYVLLSSVPGRKIPRRPGMIRPPRLREELGALLVHPDVLDVGLSTSLEARDGYRSLTWEHDALFETLSRTRGYRPAEDDDHADPWVDAVVHYADQVTACAGVIVRMASRNEVTTECWSGSVRRKDGIAHPWPEQAARMKGLNARYMGTRYMRFPRWGTLVSHDHVAQLGGVDAITTAVQPAVVRPLSGGVYVQLTASIATAMGDEAMAKQRAFIDLAAPLLPPPVTAPP